MVGRFVERAAGIMVAVKGSRSRSRGSSRVKNEGPCQIQELHEYARRRQALKARL